MANAARLHLQSLRFPNSYKTHHPRLFAFCTTYPLPKPSSLSLSTSHNPTKHLTPLTKAKPVDSETNASYPKWSDSDLPNMIDIQTTQELETALAEAGERYVSWNSTRIGVVRVAHCFLSCAGQSTAEDHPKILFMKVDFDESKKLCEAMNVRVLPYFQFYNGCEGKKVEAFACSLSKFHKIRDVKVLARGGE